MKNSSETSTSISVQEIDFSKYRTKELANRIGDLLSLPKSIGKLVVTIFLCVVIAMILINAAMKVDAQSYFATLLAEVYGLPASILFGFSVWAVLLVRRSIAALTKIVDLLLETTTRVAADYQQLSAGNRKLPPMSQLVGAVYEHVFMHVFREAIESQTGFLGTPIYWVYRLTIDRMLKIVVRFVATRTASEEDKESIKTLISESMPAIAEEEWTIISNLQWARQKIVGSGNWIGKRLLWPCYAFIAFFFALLIAPIVVALILG